MRIIISGYFWSEHIRKRWEILHNLFGDTNVLSIHVEGDGSYEFIRELEG